MEEREKYEHFNFTVDPGQQACRIDKFLMDRIPNVSRNQIQKGILEGLLTVNGEVLKKANYKVRPNDEIVAHLFEPPRLDEVIGEDIPLNITYEDDDLVIVNKEAGMVVHPAYNNWDGTLVNALVHHFDNLPTSAHSQFRPGLVHRIDKDTTGLLVIAKSDNAMKKLAEQFVDHSIHRKYYALIWGEPSEEQGTIRGHIGRSLKDRRVMTVFPDGEYGKHAVTHYKVLKRLRYVTLIECQLETGRTHQIRAHFKHIGHPLFNDATYGGDKIMKGTQFSKYRAFIQNCFKVIPRQALHAKSLGFVHPTTNENVHFESELPDDLKEVIEKWEHYVKFN